LTEGTGSSGFFIRYWFKNFLDGIWTLDGHESKTSASGQSTFYFKCISTFRCGQEH